MVVKKQTKPKVATTKTTAKSKSLVPAVVTKPNQLVVNSKKTADELVLQVWADKLTHTKSKMNRLNNAYKNILYDLLKEAYSVYSEVIRSNLADGFFTALWHELYNSGIKIQKNTPNASLVIRYICGADISTKTISEYAKVLENASYNDVNAEKFVDWLNYKTMKRVIEDQRAIANNVETRTERMARARLVIMRLIEVRETQRIHSWTTTAWEAEKIISENGLWFAIGNAHRILDGGSNFNASMNLIWLLPYNKEMEKRLLNIYAETIVDAVEHWEKKMNKMEEKIWGDELWEKLSNVGYE
jgi:hypothetical protein